MSLKLYDKSKIDFNNLMFSNGDLRKILIPVVVEQLLNSFMGMMDTMMVSNVGAAAISSVSLVDAINVLVIQVFAALATGGTVICSHYLGRKEVKKCNDAAQQVTLTVTVISVLLTVICIGLRVPLLRLIFGSVEQEVMELSLTYFLITALSFPALALFSAGGALFRSCGRTKLPMIIAMISNGLNIAGNAVLKFVLGMGVKGAALATLISRVFGMLMIYAFLRVPKQEIVIRKYFISPDFKVIKRILTIGIPSGIENGMFQFGKLAIQSSVSTLGTTAIAAQAMAIIMEGFNGIGGVGVGIGMMTVVGQCMGAGRKEETKYYIVKLTKFAEIVVLVSCVVVYIISRPVAYLAGMSPESTVIFMDMILFITITKPISWTLSFVPSYGFRAAGDVKFSMITSMCTMWACRVAISIILIRVCGVGPIAVWIGMASDWTIRAFIFSGRYMSGRWLKHRVI